KQSCHVGGNWRRGPNGRLRRHQRQQNAWTLPGGAGGSLEMNCNPGYRKDVQRSNKCALRVMNVWPIPYFVAICFFLAISGYLHAVTLKAAVAKVDITPPPGLVMYGFFDRIQQNKVSTGTLDPLFARVLLLQAGEKRLAVVTLDLGRTFNEP